MNTPSKQRQMLRITWLNMLVGLILMTVFVSNTLSLSSSLRHERDSQSLRTLEHFSESFLTEATHLRDIMSLSKSDSHLTMLASGDYDSWRAMSSDAMSAISLLKTTQKSLSSVSRLIFIAPNVERAFSGDGMISLDYLSSSEWIGTLLTADELPLDFELLENGWHAYKSCALYVQHGYNGSLLIGVVKSSQIADLNTFNRANPDQHIIVLDAEGSCFSASFSTARIDGCTDYARLQSGDKVHMLDSEYVVSRLDSDQFSFLLLTDRCTPEASYKSLNLSIALVVAAALALLMLTLFNTAYFERISRLVKSRGQTSSDIDRLRQIVQERTAWHRREIERFIPLAAARSATDRDYAAIRGTICEEFDRYFVLSLAMQKEGTAPEGDLFMQLYQFLGDHFTLCGAPAAEGRMIFIAERMPGAEHIDTILQRFFESQDGSWRVWGGISTSYSDPKYLRRAFEQAERRIMALPLRPNDTVTIADLTLPSEFSVENEQISALAKALLSGDRDLSLALYEDILYRSSPPCTLLGMQQLGEELLNALTGRNDERMALNAHAFYHPRCLFDSLEACANDLRAAQTPAAPQSASETVHSNAVVAWIEDHYMQDISLELVADQFHITPVHLSRWFKKETGINFSVFLSTLRITHARALIEADPTIKNADLTARVGLASVLTFTRQFKSQTGMTPDQYRKALH